MSGEGSLFDVPPAAFGRFRVLHQIGAGTTGPVFRGEDPDSGAAVVIKALRADLPPDRARAVADDLAGLVSSFPRHPSLAAPIAAGLSGAEPYLVTALIPGQSLDAALRDYGPAAIGDLLPRLHAVADALDLAAERGVFHSALHARDLIVSADDSVIVGLGVAPVLARAGVRIPVRRPYTAPEVADGRVAVEASDQYSFAVVAFEWMTGRRPSTPLPGKPPGPSGPKTGASDGTLVDYPAMPGIDRRAMTAAFAAALAHDPAARHQTVREFVDAIAAAADPAEAARGAAGVAAPRKRARAVVPALPLDVAADEGTPEAPAVVLGEDAGVAPPDPPRFASLDDEPAAEPPATPALPDKKPLRLVASAPAAPLRDAPLRPPDDGPVAWQAASLSVAPARSYGLGAIVTAAVLGILVGFAAAFVILRQTNLLEPASQAVGPREPVGQPPPAATAPPVPSDAGRKGSAVEGPAATATPNVAATEKTAAEKIVAAEKTPARASAAPPAPAPRVEEGSLLIRSVPSGATVTVDGTKRGVTPLTVRELELGTRRILVERAGYVTAERTVALTSGRPSRSIDVRLAAPPAAPAPSEAGRAGGRVEGPAAPAPAAAATGSLIVESRPIGARVTINGRASGTTPMTFESLAPGTYEVTLDMPGYRPFSTSVTVVAGARARAAGSLVLIQERE